ncbi:hypothetical protein Marpi_1756 [Marinitoga piezophila KA3]|uniref:Uncharacterized protein n=1 Tax=Marinitoga piezophila (strain DSM 14283 / JCM 11233 / KA3) TaxID=443254 RepID=H2J5J8_MARPK|nr:MULTISPECIES: hypothetical protein [Marinitoga]AEX86142.1 hypothetical protein Marpi_1756 [Marinitoga piezophila KA3]APT76557.1 hypothetical protein LN42_09340 [Marinitoga sp. 1137]NUU98244.1 hypothetical protein [Marinitoga sp. 1138]
MTEFKRNENLEVKNMSNTPSPNKKNKSNIEENKNFTKLLRFMLFLNILFIGIIIYVISIRYKNEAIILERLNNIEYNLSSLGTLNTNLEKLNNNFQILDIINSNVRKIPDIELDLAETKDTLKSLDTKALNNTIDRLENALKNLEKIEIKPVNIDYNSLKEDIVTSIKDELQKKFSTLESTQIINNMNKNTSEPVISKEFNSKIESIEEKLNQINYLISDLNKKQKEQDILISKIASSIINITKNSKNDDFYAQYINKLNIFDSKIEQLSKNFESLSSDNNEILSNIKNLNNKINSSFINKNDFITLKKSFENIDKKINSLETSLKINNSNINKLVKDIKNINAEISGIQSYFSKIQMDITKEIKNSEKKMLIIDEIKNLNKFIDSDDFKLINMVEGYNEIWNYIQKGQLSNDQTLNTEFSKLTEKVFDKFIEIVKIEYEDLNSRRYNINFQKDIKYINYSFNKLIKNPFNEKKYNILKDEIKKLNILESKRIEEYNNNAKLKIKEYLDLFKNKVIIKDEIIKSFKEKILTIDPELLYPEIKKEYQQVITATKDILKEKYIW